MQVVDKRIEGRWEKIEQRNIATEDAQSMAARDELVQQSRRDHINAEGRWGPISRELKIGDWQRICSFRIFGGATGQGSLD